MDITSFMDIVIVGALVSFIIDALKQKLGTDSLATKGLTIGLALVVGAGFAFLHSTEYYTAVLGVLGTASTVYALFLKK